MFWRSAFRALVQVLISMGPPKGAAHTRIQTRASRKRRKSDAAACVHAEKVPGVFTFLGIRNASAGAVHGLHTPRFTLDEGQLPLGAALHAATALRFLAGHHAAEGGVGGRLGGDATAGSGCDGSAARDRSGGGGSGQDAGMCTAD